MIKPHVLKNLQELNTLQRKKEALEREAVELWRQMKADEKKGWKIHGKIMTLHGKMNTASHRITYLFNLKGVQQAIWVTAKGVASDIIYEGVDPCWDYNDAINNRPCDWCTDFGAEIHEKVKKRRGIK